MALKLAPNVVALPVITRLDIPTERILSAALAREVPLDSVILIGVDTEGELVFYSSMADGGTVRWWMEKARMALMAADPL